MKKERNVLIQFKLMTTQYKETSIEFLFEILN